MSAFLVTDVLSDCRWRLHTVSYFHPGTEVAVGSLRLENQDQGLEW
jgi:hypothetical protein